MALNGQDFLSSLGLRQPSLKATGQLGQLGGRILTQMLNPGSALCIYQESMQAGEPPSTR